MVNGRVADIIPLDGTMLVNGVIVHVGWYARGELLHITPSAVPDSTIASTLIRGSYRC